MTFSKKRRTFWKSLPPETRDIISYSATALSIIAVISLIRYPIAEELLFPFLRYTFECCFYTTIGHILYFFYKLIWKKSVKYKMANIVFAILVAVLSIPYMPSLLGYRTTQIDSFYEAKEYTEKYYVIMSKSPESVENRKQYTLPAEIERRYDYLGTTDVRETFYGEQYGGRDVYKLNYHINYLYFPNGGYLYFDYDNKEDSDIFVEKETKVTDYHNNDYYITLTTKKAD